MATKDRTSLKNDFANGKYATGEKFADLIDSMKVVQLPVVDPQALGTSLSFIDSISQDADGKITATKKTLDLANAHELNPFKGWYKTGDTLPTDGFDGAYLYFKDTSELTGQTTIYRWNGTTYADTGTVVDTSNVQTFGSGQAVNEVKIKDENGVEVQGTANVLSAEAGISISENSRFRTAERVSSFKSHDFTRGTCYDPNNNGAIVQNTNFCSEMIVIPDNAKWLCVVGYRDNPDTKEGVCFFGSDGTTFVEGFGGVGKTPKIIPIHSSYKKVAFSAIFTLNGNTLKGFFSSVPIFNEGVFGEFTEEQKQQVLNDLNIEFSTGESLNEVGITDEVDDSHNLLNSIGVYNYLYPEELLETSVVSGQVEYNPPFTDLPLYKDKEYILSIKLSGEDAQLIKLTNLVFYPASSSVAVGHIDMPVTNLTSMKEGFDVTYTPSADIGRYKLLANSSFTGPISLEIKVKARVTRFLNQVALSEEIEMARIKDAGVDLNVFGDVLPNAFKNKLLNGDNDILVVCQGDSLTGKVDGCEQVADPTHDMPGGQYKSFVYMLQKAVGKIRPQYRRLDAEDNDVPFFTKVGTWVQATETTFSPSGTPSITDACRENSVTVLTFRSNDTAASVAFNFDADIYEKCNLVFSKSKEGASTVVTIQGGDGKMLASLDRETWVEANGFICEQATPTFTNTNGEAECQRHRRIWLKKAGSVTGTIGVAFSKSESNSNYMYFWGVEMYSGRGIFFDNIGRGGRTSSLLARNVSDVFDRNPDLTIYEIPLANDLYNQYVSSFDSLITFIDYYFNASNRTGYKIRSNDYQDFPLLVVLPHLRSGFFDSNDNAVAGSSQYNNIQEMPAYNIYKKVLGYLNTFFAEKDNVSIVNMCDQYLSECVYRYGGWKNGLTGGHLTSDGIHPNDMAAKLWKKYLAPLFYF